MLKDRVVVTEGDVSLVGTRMIGGPSILIGFRLFPPDGVPYIACVDVGLEGILIQLESEVL